MKISVFLLVFLPTLFSASYASENLKCSLMKDEKKLVSLHTIDLSRDYSGGETQSFGKDQQPTSKALHYFMRDNTINFRVTDDILSNDESNSVTVDKKIFTSLTKGSSIKLTLNGDQAYEVLCTNLKENKE